MHVKIDLERCMGNAVCVGIAPEAIDIDADGYAMVVDDRPEGEVAVRVREAARLCPTNAIDISENDF